MPLSSFIFSFVYFSFPIIERVMTGRPKWGLRLMAIDLMKHMVKPSYKMGVTDLDIERYLKYKER